MGEKPDVWQETLALMVLRTLETMGSQHGYGLAQRIEQTSSDLLVLNYHRITAPWPGLGMGRKLRPGGSFAGSRLSTVPAPLPADDRLEQTPRSDTG